MARQVLIAIPYRDDGMGWRPRAFEKVYAQAKETGHKVEVGDSGDEPFSLARTWNTIADSGPWDVLVKWTADVLLKDVSQLEPALGHPWARAYDRSVTLRQHETLRLYSRGFWPNKRIDRRMHGDGVQTVSRKAWETVGGFDPNFVGYGFEDWAWFHGMRLYHGEPVEVPGLLGVLWHPAYRGGKAEHGPDDYWRARTANWNRYEKVMAIESKADWRKYVKSR